MDSVVGAGLLLDYYSFLTPSNVLYCSVWVNMTLISVN